MAPTHFDEPVSFRCPVRGVSTTIDTAEDALVHMASWPPASGELVVTRFWGLWLCREVLIDPKLAWNARAAFQEVATAYGFRADYEGTNSS